MGAQDGAAVNGNVCELPLEALGLVQLQSGRVGAQEVLDLFHGRARVRCGREAVDIFQVGQDQILGAECRGEGVQEWSEGES